MNPGWRPLAASRRSVIAGMGCAVGPVAGDVPGALRCRRANGGFARCAQLGRRIGWYRCGSASDSVRLRDSPVPAGPAIRFESHPSGRKVAGRVLDSDCRSVAWQLVKVCPANETRRYIHKRDRPCAVIDPKSTGVGQCAGTLTSPTSVLDLVSPPLEGRTSWQ